jgi:hypothetical protein
MRVLKLAWHLIAGWGGLLVAVAAAIYYGPRKMLETWSWYMYRFRDRAVHDVIDESRWANKITSTRIGVENVLTGQPYRLPWRADEIADQLGRKRGSVVGSLKRLKAARKVRQVGNGRFPRD